MTLRFALLTTLAAGSTVLPQESSAQLRPTLEAQEQRSDAIEPAACAAADVRGDLAAAPGDLLALHGAGRESAR